MTSAQKFEELVQTHAPLVARIASTYERRPALIEELTQEVFLALYRSLPGFRGDASLRTFVARIAHNVCVDHVRQATRRPVETDSDVLVEIPDDADGPEMHADKALARDRLLEAVRNLPVAHRQVISLHLEGFEAGEIGQTLGHTPGNVRVRIHRAREALKNIMETGT